MRLDRHGRVSTYGLGPSTRDALYQPSRMLDIDMLEAIDDEIEAEMQEELREQLQEEVREELRVEILDELRMEMQNEFGEELHEEIRDELREELRDELQEEIETAFEEKVNYMQEQPDMMCACLEKAGFVIPFRCGKDESTAPEPHSCSSSQHHPDPSHDPLQELVNLD